MIYTKLYGAFFVEIKVALFAAFAISFPIIANQLWAFIAPGLYAREKKAFLPFLIATPVLFLAGASLAYFVVMPLAFPWFLGFQGELGGLQAEALPEMGEYLDLVMRFILAFGISFLLPVLLMLSASRLRDRFARLVVGGVALYFASHLVIHVAVNVGLVPMTGLPLPLVSAGGSSLLATLLALGVALGLAAHDERGLDRDAFRSF